MRNFLFNIVLLKSERFRTPVISVGNITVGGTGKTPLTEFIIRTLIPEKKVALLSRGYKRKTKGVVVGNKNSSAADIGDEPKQILDKFPQITVTVAEKRVKGIKKLLSLNASPNVIVMDDAYQHRYVKPGLSILVIDYNRPLWKDLLLPAGELREPMNGKKRADIILFSKCPQNISKYEQEKYTRKIKPSESQDVYFSSVGYLNPHSLFENSEIKTDAISGASFLVVTGIANPVPFIEHAKTISNNVETMRFPDHYQFSSEDIRNIEKHFEKTVGQNKYILTTEKDAVRFRQVLNKDAALAKHILFIPIEIKILNEKQEEFKDKIITYVSKNEGNR